MATRRENHYAISDTFPHFKDWAQSISLALIAFGWTKTADIGSIDWGTLAVVPTSTPAFEIFHANDAAQATMPFFVKIEYSGTSSQVNMWATIGTGSDGSGNLTGYVSGRYQWGTFALTSGSLYDCVYSGDTGRFACAFMRNYAGISFLSLERSKAASGADDDRYIHLTVINKAPAYYAQAVMKGGYVQTVQTNGEMHKYNGATTMLGGFIFVAPLQPVLGYMQNPHLNWLRGGLNDWNAADVASIAVYPGAPHNYMCVDVSNTTYSIQYPVMGSSTTAFLMRYD